MIPFWIAWILVLLNIALGLFLPLIYPVFVAIIVSVIVLVVSVSKGFVAPPSFLDFILVPLITVSFMVGILSAGVFAIAKVPLSTLIIAGLIADVIAFSTGFVPLFGDFFGGVFNAVLVFIIINQVAGGVTGIFLAFIAFLLTMLPGPFPLVTIGFLAIRFFTEVLG